MKGYTGLHRAVIMWNFTSRDPLLTGGGGGYSNPASRHPKLKQIASIKFWKKLTILCGGYLNNKEIQDKVRTPEESNGRPKKS